MIEKHLMKLRARDEISAEEENAIRAGVTKVIEVKGGRPAVREGQVMDYSTILLTGMAARQKSLASGHYQFTELHVPGDFTDLHSFTLKHLDHDIMALCDCSFAIMPHEYLREITERFPHLARVYWFETNLDACIHREWELSLGSRSAIAAMCHLFCEMHVRLNLVGLVEDGRFELPISQQDLAEMLGITPVHANRTLQNLRKQGFVEFAGRVVTISDMSRLEETAEFDPSYLYLERRRH